VRVLCCFSRAKVRDRSSFHPLAEAALRRYAPHTEFVDVSRSDTAYAHTLADYWARGESFLNVEHDVEIHERVVRQATHCPELWCVWPYMGPGWPHHHLPELDAFLYNSLGCTRFHRKLLAAEPDAMSVAAGIKHGDEFRAAHWLRMDAEVSPLLIGRGYRPHLHWPEVVHHHLYSANGVAACACGRTHE
jgi:hypothetical protein